MNILVTGSSGFTGRHMIHFLSGLDLPGKNVVGVFHSTIPQTLPGTSFVQCDLRNRGETRDMIACVQPDRVIHLAGINRGSLERLLTDNVVCTQNLLESLLKNNFDGRVLVTGSSAEYGYNGGLPITEKNPLKPVSDYGISKVASSLLSLRYHEVEGLKVCIARPFNLTGPGQGDNLVCGRILDQIMKINGGLQDEILLSSSLDSRRDFIDVRDAVRAYWALISHSRFEEECAGQVFNIGSGKDYLISSVHELFEKIFRKTYPLAPVKTSTIDPVPQQVSDIRFIQQTVGWLPEIDLETSLFDMVHPSGSEA
jgi:GDP-4-dehydro-6-deoxy-D-mannose reductase